MQPGYQKKNIQLDTGKLGSRLELFLISHLAKVNELVVTNFRQFLAYTINFLAIGKCQPWVGMLYKGILHPTLLSYSMRTGLCYSSKNTTAWVFQWCGQPGFELVTNQSVVPHPNHYTTDVSAVMLYVPQTRSKLGLTLAMLYAIPVSQE